MSKQAKQWASRQQIASGSMKAVLAELAYLHKEGRDLFPSQSYLAEKLGMSVRSVRYHLQLLAHFGLIQRKARSNGARGRTSDLFILALAADREITKKQISTARRGMRTPISKRQTLPLVEKSQPAPFAGPPGTVCRGIGELIEEPNQVGTELSVEHCTREGQTDRPELKLLAGGRA